MRNKENGITLLALIVTVIVMVIIAGAAITLILNSNLIDKTKAGVDKYSAKANETQEELDYLGNRLEYYTYASRGATAEINYEELKQSLKVDLKDELKTEIFEETYPVGSIYMSSVLDTPEKVKNSLGGGTWEKFGQGRTLIGE